MLKGFFSSGFQENMEEVNDSVDENFIENSQVSCFTQLKRERGQT